MQPLMSCSMSLILLCIALKALSASWRMSLSTPGFVLVKLFICFKRLNETRATLYLRCRHKNFAPLTVQNAPSEDSDQTAHIHRLILTFAGRTMLHILQKTLGRNIFHVF